MRLIKFTINVRKNIGNNFRENKYTISILFLKWEIKFKLFVLKPD